MDHDLTGRAALVTGGSSGLGAAIAKRLAGAGACVAVLGRSAEGLEQTVAAISEAGGKASAIQGDLSEAGTAERAIASAIADFGHVDILVNNAAVMFMDSASEMDRSRYDKMFAVNVYAVVEGCQAMIRHLRETGRDGHIVSISSLASRLVGGGLYGATKSAVETYAEQLRLELENDPIRITTVVPGGFSTNLGRDMTPGQQAAFQSVMGAKLAVAEPDTDGRTPYFGIPDDIARAVLFAVSQPINLNVQELVVRPARNIDPSAFNE